MNQPSRNEEVQLERICLGLFVAYFALLALSFTL